VLSRDAALAGDAAGAILDDRGHAGGGRRALVPACGAAGGLPSPAGAMADANRVSGAGD